MGGSGPDVRALYEVYPYPSPVVGDDLIEDVANCLYSLYGEDPLEGWKVLDAGCGTGHRLAGVARRYARAEFVGIDMTTASLEVAEQLTARHRLRNVRLQEGNLLDLKVSGKFDLVISSGVIHHLEDPRRGLQNLASLLSPDGVLVVWLYHAIGEHDRLMARELLRTMWNPATGLEQGVRLMRELGLQLEAKRYGSTAAQRTGAISQLNVDADAYLHPIVNAYRFEDALALFRGCRELTWAAVNNINLLGASRLLDLAQAASEETRYFCQSVEDLFETDPLRMRFRGLGNLEKLRVIELKLKPNGFTMVSGRGRSFARLGRRLIGNAIELRGGP
jgi:SAM-dependent methyltransferase